MAEDEKEYNLEDLDKDDLLKVIGQMQQTIETLADTSVPEIGPEYLEVSVTGVGTFKMNSPTSVNAELFENLKDFISFLKRPTATSRDSEMI